MKSFRQYLAESTKERQFVIKLAAAPTDHQLDVIEQTLKKYDLVDLSKPEKMERQNIDFFQIPRHDTWQLIATVTMPITSYVLMQDLKMALNIPEDMIVVRGSMEPVEIHAEEMEADGPAYDPIQDQDHLPASRLSTDRLYADAEQPLVTDVFGDEYNKRLLDYLRSVEDDRRTTHYEAPAPLFSWIDMDKAMAADEVQGEDFNVGHDTPKPVYAKGKDAKPIDTRYLGPSGNFDDAAASRVKITKDAKGKHDAISAPRAKIKAEKGK